MIDRKNFFDQSVKNNKATYDNIRKLATGQGDDYTTGYLLTISTQTISTQTISTQTISIILT